MQQLRLGEELVRATSLCACQSQSLQPRRAFPISFGSLWRYDFEVC